MKQSYSMGEAAAATIKIKDGRPVMDKTLLDWFRDDGIDLELYRSKIDRREYEIPLDVLRAVVKKRKRYQLRGLSKGTTVPRSHHSDAEKQALKQQIKQIEAELQAKRDAEQAAQKAHNERLAALLESSSIPTQSSQFDHPAASRRPPGPISATPRRERARKEGHVANKRGPGVLNYDDKGEMTFGSIADLIVLHSKYSRDHARHQLAARWMESKDRINRETVLIFLIKHMRQLGVLKDFCRCTNAPRERDPRQLTREGCSCHTLKAHPVGFDAEEEISTNHA